MNIKDAVDKIEELQRLLLSQKKKAELNAAVCNIMLYSQFTSTCFIKQSFECLSSGSVTADLTIELDSPQAAVCEITAGIDGVYADRKSINTGSGKGQYSVCFSVPVTAGVFTLEFAVSFGDGVLRRINGACVRLFGGVRALGGGGRLAVSAEGEFVCVTHSDERYVYYSVLDGDDISLSIVFNKRGDYAFCECKHSEAWKYDLIYFYTDGGRLYMCAMPCYSDFEEYRVVIDEGVTSVAAAASDSPKGSMLYYLKGGNVYAAGVAKENGLLIPCSYGIAASSPLAKKVSSVEGLGGGCAFILSEKNGQNRLYLHGGDFAGLTADTVSAEISAYIEV